MPDPNRIEAGRRFARDLRRIREDRGLSVQALNEETKMPRGLIESFEDSGLFDHPTFNEVYLRSFVRTYADFVGIDVEATIEALTTALQGRYRGALAERYLGEASGPDDASDIPETETTKAGALPAETSTGKPASVRRAPAEDASASPGRTVPRASEGPASTPGAHRRGPAEKTSTADNDAAPEAEATSRTPVGERPHAEGTEAGGPPAGEASPTTPRARRSRYAQRDERRSPMGLVLGTLGVLAVVAILVVWLLGGADETDLSPEEGPTVADTASAAGPPPASARPAPVDVGETLDVTIVAAGGAVQGLRVRRDGDLRRPYWIDEGTGTLFVAENRMTIENPASGTAAIDRIRLLVEGYAYPVPERDAQGRLVLTREDVQTWLQQPPGETDAFVPADTVRLP